MGPLRSWTMASATSRAAAARRCHEARHRCECGASSSPSVAAEHLAGGLSFLAGFIGKADALAAPVVVDVEGSGYGLVVTDKVAVVADPADPTATFTGPLEAAIRLVGGRLRPANTPESVKVTGAVTLDDLRRVFPGF